MSLSASNESRTSLPLQSLLYTTSTPLRSWRIGPSPCLPPKPPLSFLTLKTGRKFYLTTAINYTNGDPHFGHAYEAVLSDVICRFHRSAGRRVFFLTGTDEHGQKVQKSAEARNVSPQEHCDYYANRFKHLDGLLNISYDRFVRTTEPDHKAATKKLWRIVKEDIYLSNYQGWYNKYEEQFVTAAEVEQSPKNEQGVPLDAHGRELELKNEEAYFFKMSLYAKPLLEHIKANPHFVQPSSARGEILSFLENNVLEDLCVSRTTITWGVPVPTDVDGVDDPRHVMYVWFDALTNYLTGVNGLDPEKNEFWPADVHVIGKDIVRFHCVYWATMLMAAGVPLPKCVFAHGFVTAADGQKMSKSLNNGRDPIEEMNLYGVDALRYYMSRSAAFGWDVAYNEDILCDVHNDILLKGFGNLVQRVYKVACDNCADPKDSTIPMVPDCEPEGLPFDVRALQNEFESCFSVMPSYASETVEMLGDLGDERCGLRVRDACCFLEKCVTDTNVFVDRCEPWKHKGDENAEYRKRCARAFLEAVFILANFFRTFIPNISARIVNEVLQMEFAENVMELGVDFKNLKPGTKLRKCDAANPLILFEAIQPKIGKKPKLSGEELLKAKELEKQQKEQQKNSNKEAKVAKAAAATANPMDSIDVRVGIIRSAVRCEGTKLYLEKVSISHDDSVMLDVASGIADAYPTGESLVGKRVLCIVNFEPFKPKQAPEFESKGMLLAAKLGEFLELVEPPAEAGLGERVGVVGGAVSTASLSGASLPRATSKQWDKAKHALKIDAHGMVKCGEDVVVAIACHKPCTALTVRNGTVS